jgi:Uncharacterized conserved protein (COG2071)
MAVGADLQLAILSARGPEMLHLLKRHRVPIKAHLAASLVLAYAVPQDVLKPFLAPGLELDTYGEFGFLAIAMVETRDLRPAFIPSAFGLDFFLAGYRIFTRYRTVAGRSLRGLRILRSDTDRQSMRLFGNLLTHYGYELSHCSTRRIADTYGVEICSPRGDADLLVEADIKNEPELPPPNSPFQTSARRANSPGRCHLLSITSDRLTRSFGSKAFGGSGIRGRSQ